MIIILKRIKENVRAPDIHIFLEPALQGGFFNKAGRIKSITIQMCRQNDSNKVEYHALVEIEPYTVAKRIIKTLNRKPCNGKPINVMEYHFRTLGNDRRQSRYQAANDRRTSDRRRKNLQIIDITTENPKHRSIAIKGIDEDIDWF
jgi:hypothetical protein